MGDVLLKTIESSLFGKKTPEERVVRIPSACNIFLSSEAPLEICCLVYISPFQRRFCLSEPRVISLEVRSAAGEAEVPGLAGLEFFEEI
jgi:hypothetical protein